MSRLKTHYRDFIHKHGIKTTFAFFAVAIAGLAAASVDKDPRRKHLESIAGGTGIAGVMILGDARDAEQRRRAKEAKKQPPAPKA